MAVTSSVWGRTSFGGGRRPTFHDESLFAGLLQGEKKSNEPLNGRAIVKKNNARG